MLWTDDEGHVLQYVDALVHDALAPSDAKIVADHCQHCPICQTALEQAYKRIALLQTIPPVEASDALIRAAEEKIAQYRAPWITPARVGWSLAAAAVLCLVALHIRYATLAPTPYELTVLGQTEWIADSQGSLRVLLVDHHTRQPLANTPVEIDLADKARKTTVQLAVFTTDALGTGQPRFRLPAWSDGTYELQVYARPGNTIETVAREIKLRRSWQLMLTSDKPLYQPGQTIRLRSLALARPDLKPVAGQAISLSVADPKGNVIFRTREVTSRFGIASADCPLADEIVEGTYRVECTLGDTTCSLSLDVRKYVLPKFKVDIALDQPYLLPGQKIRVSVEARYFFGKPVAGADVELIAQSRDVDVSTFGTHRTQTDDQGLAQFETTLPTKLFGRPQTDGDAEIRLVVNVRDSAGQKATKSFLRVVAAQPIRVEVIPEAGRLVRGVPNTIHLFTTYPNGQAAHTRISVTGIDRELTANWLGVTSFEFTPQSDSATFTIRATDNEGRTGRREVTLDCGKTDSDFLVRTDQAVYDGGQTMHVLALGSGSDPVFFDLVKDGQTMLTEVIRMDNGQGRYDLDLPPELFGTVMLCAYRFGPEGWPVNKSRVLYVRQPGSLSIQTQWDKQYRPGDRAKLVFQLTDDRGRPAPGALTLTAVDEAVFSAFSYRPASDQTFFTLEQELLKPVYAIYPWTPDTTRKVSPLQRQSLEQAIFARTAQQPAGSERLNEIIDRYGDHDRRLLDVLKRPDWEKLAQDLQVVPETIGMLREAAGNTSSHTLVINSFPEKNCRVRAEQRELEGLLAMLWVGVVLGGIVTVVVVFCVKGGTLLEVLAFITITGILLGLLMPGLQSTRECSPLAKACNNLRQLDLATHAAKELEGPAKPQAAPARVRQWFPETLLWRPELITDDGGRASVEVELADSITTWRVTASAVSADGKLGAQQADLRVFQPFFVDVDLPLSITRGDEVTMPMVVYNYLDRPQTVELSLADAPWFERQGQAVQKLELKANEVRSVGYRIRASQVGHHTLVIEARAADVTDAVRRQIEVIPDGRPIRFLQNGSLATPVQLDWNVPAEAIPGSVRALVRVYPSTFSQVVEGLDAIFQLPYGCFEQTSSTTYPNVLALDYLRRIKKNAPAVEAKAKQYIHLGYQRLLGFEVAGGGFDWFGHPPANRTLTAYGLMEFSDMARVHDVDPQLLDRTRRWLLNQRQPDGSWQPDYLRLHDDPTTADARLGTTAYIAWAALADRPDDPDAGPTRQWLLSHANDATADPYTLAMVCNALVAVKADPSVVRPLVDRLDSLRCKSSDGKLAWWELAAGRHTMFYGGGRCASVEITALAALAMMETGQHPETVRQSLAWLVTQKDSRGTWYSTQATVWTLRALTKSIGRVLATNQARRIEVRLDGKLVQGLDIAPDQADVVQHFDLSTSVTKGQHRLSIAEPTNTGANYQTILSYHVPGAPPSADREPLSIRLAYDKTTLAVNDTVSVTATVVNRTSEPAPMVILDLPIPAGFAIEADDLARLVKSNKVDRYQVSPLRATLYLRQLQPSQPLKLRYHLRATMPVQVAAPPARVYEYYNPDRHATGGAATLVVKAG
jgi:uncharacterized protein YfaS (alpha-2-macroglobulin family)